MGFTKALYYPTMDIENEEWLKNAILFWDEIFTIVPSSIDNPYNHNSTRFLADEGILKPIHVNSNHNFIESLTVDTLNYLNTNEGLQLLTQGQSRNSQIDKGKLPKEINRIFFNIHQEKLSYEIQNQLRQSFSHDGWFEVDSNFAMFYMTLLANKICEQKSIALLADNSLTSNLTDLVRLDNQTSINVRVRDYEYYGNERYVNIAQGLLTNLIIKGIKISNTSSLVDIINFKRKHQDELGLFRTNIAKLTKDVSDDTPFEALKQQVEDIYNDEFLPSYNNFKKALDSSGIKWVSDNFMKISVISTSATGLPMALLGLGLPQALLAGAGVSLISSLISYNQDKKEKLNTNPYSYLLAVDKNK